jgi:hypothetical protein
VSRKAADVAASSRVDIFISKKTNDDLDDLALAVAAGFNEKLINKALQAAALYAAKAQVAPVKNAAPKRTGRLRRAIWANPVMRDKPGAYVGIRAGSSRADTKGAYYRYVVTSGVRRVPYTIAPKRSSGAQALKMPDGRFRYAVVRTSAISGKPFVADTVNRNMDTVLRMFSEGLASIIEKGIPKRGSIRVRIPKPR